MATDKQLVKQTESHPTKTEPVKKMSAIDIADQFYDNLCQLKALNCLTSAVLEDGLNKDEREGFMGLFNRLVERFEYLKTQLS